MFEPISSTRRKDLKELINDREAYEVWTNTPEYAAWQASCSPAQSRLSIPPVPRIALTSLGSTVIGAALGISYGASSAGMRYRAENAHRLPSTQTGWYLYHKSKNYNMMLGGIKEGAKMGLKIGGWVTAFFVIEEGWDQVRGEKDFLNTVLASASVAGGFSLWNRFPLQTAAKTARSGLAIGLAYGLAQDALAVIKGRRPGYVQFIMRGGRRAPDAEITTNSV